MSPLSDRSSDSEPDSEDDRFINDDSSEAGESSVESEDSDYMPEDIEIIVSGIKGPDGMGFSFDIRSDLPQAEIDDIVAKLFGEEVASII